MARDLRGAVVVITGASSGIGRATAHAFSREGARLALAARAQATLDEAARECEQLGAETLAVVTDVRDEDAVAALATRAVQRFGRIDVWVNNAGVMAYGRFEELPSELFRAVVETNLFGMVHGARAALPHFRRQGGGTLINMSSVWGRVTSPEVGAYVTSKYAIRGFTDCLRQELADAPGIAVTAILPQAVDTPIFEQAANHTGHAMRPVPPLLRPERIARAIVRCARSPRREVTCARSGWLLGRVAAFAPRAFDRMLAPAIAAGSAAGGPAAPTPGNLLAPRPQAERVDAGWRRERRRELLRAAAAAAGAALRGLVRGPG